MKKVIALCLLVVVIISCHTKPKMKDKNIPPLNNIDHLAKYTVTEKQKYYFNLLNTYMKNPESLMGKKMNPATDEEAKKLAEERFLMLKRYVIKSNRLERKSRSTSIKTIKALEKDKKNIFYLLKNPPKDADYAAVILKMGLHSQYFKESPKVVIHFDTNNEENSALKMKEIIEAFSFLDKDSSWKKHKNLILNIYKNNLKINQSDLEVYKKKYKENEASNNTRLYKKVKMDLEKKIKKTENLINYFKKTTKKLNNDDFEQLVYIHNLKSNDPNRPNMLVIGINNRYDNVGIVISKTIWK